MAAKTLEEFIIQELESTRKELKEKEDQLTSAKNFIAKVKNIVDDFKIEESEQCFELYYKEDYITMFSKNSEKCELIELINLFKDKEWNCGKYKN